jgi:hypothetical protein
MSRFLSYVSMSRSLTLSVNRGKDINLLYLIFVSAQLRDGQFKDGVFQGVGEVDTKATYAEEERRNQEEDAAKQGKPLPKGGLLSRFMPMLPGRKKVTTAVGSDGNDSGAQKFRQDDLTPSKPANAGSDKDAVFFELKNILRSRSLDNIISKSLARFDDEVRLYGLKYIIF